MGNGILATVEAVINRARLLTVFFKLFTSHMNNSVVNFVNFLYLFERFLFL